MALVSKEWIHEFHEAEGHGLDPAPLVEAALLAHELLDALREVKSRIVLPVTLAGLVDDAIAKASSGLVNG